MNVPRLRFKDENGREFPELERKILEEMANVERGKFSVRPRNDPRYFGGSIPFVQTGDIVSSDLYLKKYSQTLNEEGLKVSRLFPKNTILITIAANIGDTTITDFEVACTDSVVAIMPFQDHAVSVWLKYSLDTKKEELDSKSTQNAQKNINLQTLRPLTFNTPSFPEQTKIANFLTAIDEKITQLTQKNDLLKQYKKGIMQQIFSQKLRFKDDDGWEFPEWEINELGNLAAKVNLKNRNIEINNVLTNSATQGIVSQNDYFDRDIANKNNLDGYYIVEIDDFVYNPRISSNAPVGPIKRNRHIKGVMSPLYTVFRFQNGHQAFFEHFFETNYWHDYMKSISNFGARHDRMNITNESFFALPISLPSLKEQTKIANFLTAIDDKITHTQTHLNAVKLYKKGLLQQLFV